MNFKKLYLFLLLGSFWMISPAQVYLGFGYAQGFARMKNLNHIANSYNLEWFTTKRMNRYLLPGGEYLSVGYRGDESFFELGWNGNRQGMIAKGPNVQGNIVKKVVRVDISTFEISGGIALQQTETGATFLGASLGVGSIRAVVDPVKLLDFNRRPVVSKTNVAAKVFFSFEVKESEDAKLPLIVRPYFQYSFSQIDFRTVHQVVNPATAIAESFPSLVARPVTAGILFALFFNTGQKL